MTILVGLIGAGNISETHARAVGAIAGAELVAVYGTNPSKVERLAREHGGHRITISEHSSITARWTWLRSEARLACMAFTGLRLRITDCTC